MKRLSLLGTIFLLAVTPNIGCAADEKPPANAKPFSEIARTIEQRADFQAFESIEFEHGVYEVEYYTRRGKRRNSTLIPSRGRRNEMRARASAAAYRMAHTARSLQRYDNGV